MNCLGSVLFHPVSCDEVFSPCCNHLLIPVYGYIPCGEPRFVDDELSGYLEVPESMLGTGEFFVLRANGDSMIGAGINNGDLVIVKRQNHADEGEIVVAYVEGETTLKRFYKNNEQQLIELRPENENFKPIYASDCLILGVAAKVIKDL